jgi:pimeloyl-ACP methyl ester carboxylesterase
VARRLAADNKICAIAVDHRAHGNSDVPTDARGFAWLNHGADSVRLVDEVAERTGREVDAVVTHSFSGDSFLLALSGAPVHPAGDAAFSEPSLRAKALERAHAARLILLDPVLADGEGAATGGARLAAATRKLENSEADGFETPQQVGARFEKLLRTNFEPEALAAFAEHACKWDATSLRWRLCCSRDDEANVYERRVPLADALDARTRQINNSVQLVFAARRRAPPAEHAAAFDRDWAQAQRVVAACGAGSQVHCVDNVGHFLVLEAPSVVASLVARLLDLPRPGV